MQQISKPSRDITEVYAGILKHKHKVWMSALNDMPGIGIKKDCWIISMEGTKKGKYFAKRIRLCP